MLRLLSPSQDSFDNDWFYDTFYIIKPVIGLNNGEF